MTNQLTTNAVLFRVFPSNRNPFSEPARFGSVSELRINTDTVSSSAFLLTTFSLYMYIVYLWLVVSYSLEYLFHAVR